MCVCICVYRCLYVHVGACACMHVTCVWTWMRICVCCICYVWMCLHVWVALNINLHPHERANVKHWSIKEKNMGNPNAKNHKRDNITFITPPNKKTNSRACTVLVPKGFKTKKPNLLIFFIQIFMKFTCDVTDSSPYSIIQPYHAQRNFLKSRLMKSEFITFLCFSFPCGSVFLQRGSSLLQLD